MAPGYARQILYYSNGNEVSANNWENGASSGTGMAMQRRRANARIQKRLRLGYLDFPGESGNVKQVT